MTSLNTSDDFVHDRFVRNSWAPYGADSTQVNSVNLISNTKVGITNDNYESDIAAMHEAGTVYSRKKLEYCTNLFMQGRVRYTWTDRSSYYAMSSRGLERASVAGFLKAPPTDTVLRDQALAIVKGKLARDTKSIKSIAPLAELGELRGSLNTLTNLASDAVKSLIDLKHGRVKDVAKRASDHWLNFNFGISPLIGDINGAIDAINENLNGSAKIIKHHGYREKHWNTVGNDVSESFALGFGAGTSRATYRHRLAYKYSAAFAARVSGANQYSPLDRLGLSASDLPGAAWELTPYSWVADYFSTAGDYFSDMFYVPPGQTIYLSFSTLYEVEGYSQFVKDPPPSVGGTYNFRDHYFVSRPGKSRGYVYSRSVLSSLPHRDLRLKTADEIGYNSLKKLANLAAVLLK